MRVLGVAVEVVQSGRPKVRAVLVEKTPTAREVVDTFEIPTSGEDIAQRLYDLHRAVETRVRSLPPLDRVVVRRADVATRANNTDGPRQRLLAEGAIISALRSVVQDTKVGTGLELSRWYGSDKASMLADARAALDSADVAAAYVEAAAAALTGVEM